MASVLQSVCIIDMRPRTIRKISDDHGEALELIPRDVHLPVPECTKRNDKNSRPFRAVQGPTRKKPFRRDISGATTDAERLSSGFFPYFPNEPVVIKMQEGGSGHHPGKYAFDYVDPRSEEHTSELQSPMY